MDVERHPSPQNPPVSPSPASLNTSTPIVSRNPTAPYDPTPPPDFSQAVSLARRAVVAFLKESTAEEIIPEASRVALIDSTLTLKHAFRALVENGASCKRHASLSNLSAMEHPKYLLMFLSCIHPFTIKIQVSKRPRLSISLRKSCAVPSQFPTFWMLS